MTNVRVPLFPGAGLLALRLAVGLVFAWHGVDKLADLSAAERVFESFGIPLPGVMAPFVGITETAGGLLLALGLATRLAAVALAGDMLVALATAHDEFAFFAKDGGIELELLLACACAGIVLAGPGRLSLDAVMQRRPRGARASGPRARRAARAAS